MMYNTKSTPPPPPPKVSEIQFGTKYAGKTMDGRDVIAHEIKGSEYYQVFYLTPKKTGDKPIVHKDKLRNMKERKS